MAVRPEALTNWSTPPTPMEDMGDQTFSEQHPRSEGVFDYNSKIVDIAPTKRPETDQHGNILRRYRAVFDDGVKLGINHYQPAERQSDVPILQTPAWMTGLHGHNQISQHKLAQAGFDSLLIGHVGEERDSWPKEIGRLLLHPLEVGKELTNIRLARQAHHMLQIQRAMPALTGLSASEAYVFGESRGAMTGLAVLAMAKAYGVDVKKAFLVSPCFETGFGEETAAEFSWQLPAEFIGLFGDIGHVSLSRLVRSANTVNLSPKSFVYELAHGPALFNGDAGTFVDHIPADQNAMILGFHNDFAGQTSRWEERFEDFPNVWVQHAPKAHVSGIMDERTIALATDYFLGRRLVKSVK